MVAQCLQIHKEAFSFSAGHFTIFSATEREALHGHNYDVSIRFKIQIQENGLAFDYRIYKHKLAKLCSELDRHFLLPSLSAYLKINESASHYLAHFNDEQIPFLKKDVKILPLSNITIEELAQWFLNNMKTMLQPEHGILAIAVQVYNSPCQSAEAYYGSWEN